MSTDTRVSRTVFAAQAVADLLSRLDDPADGLTVERAYAPDWFDVDHWKDNPDLANRFLRRHAYVFGTKGSLALATRGQDWQDATVTVVALERYDGAQGREVPPDWLDARVTWAEEEVVKRVADARGEPVDGAFAVVAAAWDAYGPDLLRALKLWRFEAAFTFRFDVDS